MEQANEKVNTSKKKTVTIKLKRNWDALDFVTLFGSLQNIYNYFFLMLKMIDELKQENTLSLRKYRRIMNVMNGFYNYTTLIRKENPFPGIGSEVISFNTEIRKEVWNYHYSLEVTSMHFGTTNILRIKGDANAMNYINDIMTRLWNLCEDKKQKDPGPDFKTSYNEVAHAIFTIRIDILLIKAYKDYGLSEAEIRSIKKYEILNAEQLCDLILKNKIE
ncbi:MAG: hypothetical protein H0W62_06735 [Chitinophagales bacterium]|nr:hypothetical protein [Chitinophagales bacterium]